MARSTPKTRPNVIQKQPDSRKLTRQRTPSASAPRRQILAYLAHAELNAGEIASRFAISKPAVSQHLAVLENAGLIESEKRGQFVFYRLVADNLANTLNAYVQEVCLIARPIKAESASLAAKRVAREG